MNRRLIALLAIFALFTLIPAISAGDPYWLSLFTKVFINMMFAVSMWPLFVVGRLTLAHGAFYGMGAYGVSILMINLKMNFWLAVPMVILVVCLIAYLFGKPSLSIFGAQFTMATFALNEVLRLSYLRFDNPFGGAQGLIGVPSPSPLALPFLPAIEFDSLVSQYFLVLTILVVITLAYYRYVHSYLGLVMHSIHEGAHLARTMGVNVFRYEMTTFVITAAGATLAGAFYAVWAQYLEPNLFGFHKSIEAQAFVIVGGAGSAIGPIIGAAFMSLLPEYLQMAREASPIITGSALILTMLFLKGGFVTLPTELMKGGHRLVSSVGKLIGVRPAGGLRAAERTALGDDA